jgi:hypothetical protein
MAGHHCDQDVYLNDFSAIKDPKFSSDILV